MEAESEQAESTVVEYRIPTTLVLYSEPHEEMEHDTFNVQPKIKVLDAMVRSTAMVYYAIAW